MYGYLVNDLAHIVKLQDLTSQFFAHLGIHTAVFDKYLLNAAEHGFPHTLFHMIQLLLIKCSRLSIQIVFAFRKTEEFCPLHSLYQDTDYIFRQFHKLLYLRNSSDFI